MIDDKPHSDDFDYDDDYDVMIFTMMLNISFMVSFRFMFVIEHPLASYKMRKVIKILLVRPSQLDKIEQNAHCWDKHLKQTYTV